MSCYHPALIKRFVDIDGVFSAKFIGSIASAEEMTRFLQDKYTGCATNDSLNYVTIPCGKCIGCRMDYSRSWADRMTYHSLTTSDNYFITLTYDDEHIQNLDYSPIYDLHALDMDDLSRFIKSLRNHFRGCNIDFYGAGEYGDNEFRPHFHVIVYNCPLDDLEYWKLNNNGDIIYTSSIVEKLWSKGFCSISKFNWHSAAYTASYVEKKRDGRAMCEYTAVGLTPERCRMSRRPGIAYQYYLDNYKDIWKNNGLFVDRTVNSSGKLGIPRYFRKLALKGKDFGYHDFIDWQSRILEEQNLLNPFHIENSSFDLSHIKQMLEFEEREVLSKKVNKKI